MNDIVRRLRRVLLLAVIAVSFATAATCGRSSRAAEPGDERITLAGLQLGRHVSGPACTAESLAHRPVLLEFWGIHCPPCLKSMPLLEEMHRTLGPQGLVVIGAHAQDGSADEIRAAVTQREVTFTIVEQAVVQGGMDFTGIPRTARGARPEDARRRGRAKSQRSAERGGGAAAVRGGVSRQRSRHRGRPHAAGMEEGC